MIVALALAAYATPLLLAGFCDSRTLHIPNGVVAALALLYPAAALLLGRGGEVPFHLLAGLAMLAAAVPLFAFRAMGGGDVKLLAAAALWVGFAELADFVLATALLGGIFALAVLAYRRLTKGGAGPIPYGVPIAAAGLLMAPAILFPH